MSFAQTTLLIAVMVSVSAVFWIVFVQTLHLPMLRAGLDNSKVAIDRALGVVPLYGSDLNAKLPRECVAFSRPSPRVRSRSRAALSRHP